MEKLEGEGLILVIDDELPVRMAAEAALRHYGYQVVVAENGAEGIARLREAAGLFAAVILDATMPVQGGGETLRMIHTVRPDVPVIVSSGHPESEARRLFPPEEIAAFLQKPYTAKSLARTLKAVLPAANVRRQAQ